VFSVNCEGEGESEKGEGERWMPTAITLSYSNLLYLLPPTRSIGDYCHLNF